MYAIYSDCSQTLKTKRKCYCYCCAQSAWAQLLGRMAGNESKSFPVNSEKTHVLTLVVVSCTCMAYWSWLSLVDWRATSTLAVATVSFQIHYATSSCTKWNVHMQWFACLYVVPSSQPSCRFQAPRESTGGNLKSGTAIRYKYSRGGRKAMGGVTVHWLNDLLVVKKSIVNDTHTGLNLAQHAWYPIYTNPHNTGSS